MARTVMFAQLFTVLITASSAQSNFEDLLVSQANTLTEVRFRSTGFPDPIVDEILEEWILSNSSTNAEEMGSYFEGDILHYPVTGANGIISLRYRWPGAVVPYTIASGYTASERAVLNRAFQSYHLFTCIRFRPFRSGDLDYISIEKGTGGCFSSVGRVGGKQVVNLPAACLARIGTPIHELMHAVGFFHEQSRLDRDGFVDIIFANIETGKESNFRKETSTPFGQSYDFGSVMHYSALAFSKNGQPTIRTKPANNAIGQRLGFSARDLRKINLMYRCRV